MRHFLHMGDPRNPAPHNNTHRSISTPANQLSRDSGFGHNLEMSRSEFLVSWDCQLSDKFYLTFSVGFLCLPFRLTAMQTSTTTIPDLLVYKTSRNSITAQRLYSRMIVKAAQMLIIPTDNLTSILYSDSDTNLFAEENVRSRAVKICCEDNYT